MDKLSPKPRKRVVLGLLGTTLDGGKGPRRWDHWRPSVAICQHEDFLVHRFELLYPRAHTALFEVVAEDIRTVSPETTLRPHLIELQDPWNLEEVYAALYDFARAYPFDTEHEDYLVHITTGTHVAQICMFLLTESRHIPARLLQSSPTQRNKRNVAGSYTLIDLDLSTYDKLASRFQREQHTGVSLLKAGIETRNTAFNHLIARIEHVASHTTDSILLTGATGTGKSHLARRIYELKKQRRQVQGDFVEVNCATIRGDGAMSSLFGHVRGSFTGAVQARAGMLKQAHGGVLFLDELGELGLDEQAMLLRAIEEKSFFPVGSDRHVESDFQLLAGTNRELRREVSAGRFREDLLARIQLWTFRLPSLVERPEDLPPNLTHELELCSHRLQRRITMTRAAQTQFLAFASSPEALWTGNFRDFRGAIQRMATLCANGKILPTDVAEERTRLRAQWGGVFRNVAPTHPLCRAVLGAQLDTVDDFDRAQLEAVLAVCRSAPTLSAAGRSLFQVSRTMKQQANDADRVRKFLLRFGLAWQNLQPMLRKLAMPEGAEPPETP